MEKAIKEAIKQEQEVIGFTYVWKEQESNQAEKLVEEILNE